MTDLLCMATELGARRDFNYLEAEVPEDARAQIDRLGEGLAKADGAMREEILARLTECAAWYVKRAANSVLQEMDKERAWPEVEDDWEWWKHEPCHYYPNEGEYDCHTDPLVDPEYNEVYDGEAYCSRHFEWMSSEAMDCHKCGEEVSEEEFYNSAVETGDPDTPYCAKCLKLAEVPKIV